MSKLEIIIISTLLLLSISGFCEDINFALTTNIASGTGKTGDTMQLLLTVTNNTDQTVSGDFYHGFDQTVYKAGFIQAGADNDYRDDGNHGIAAKSGKSFFRRNQMKQGE